MSQWLLTLGPRATRGAVRPRLRIVAMPHAGGWPSAFAGWRRLLPPDVELVVAQLPGRGFRSDEEPLRRVAPIVDGLAGALRQLEPLPTVFVGHSFGSVLAYELTRTMERAGAPPELLAVSARQPPCFPSSAPYAYLKSDADLTEHLVGMGGMPSQLAGRSEMVAMALRTVRADLEALETHERPPSGTDVPILSLGAIDDPVVIADRLHLWTLETSGPFTQVMLSGGHFYLFRPPVAEVVVRSILSRVPAPAAVPGWERAAS